MLHKFLFLCVFIEIYSTCALTISTKFHRNSKFSRVSVKNENSKFTLFCERGKGLTTNGVISENRKAQHEYEFDDRLVAGIVLLGTEVKSCRRNGNVQISDGLAEIRDGEMWLLNVHIADHDRSGFRNRHEPKRMRKLLLTQREVVISLNCCFAIC
jgi:hypothetical protein